MNKVFISAVSLVLAFTAWGQTQAQNDNDLSTRGARHKESSSAQKPVPTRAASRTVTNTRPVATQRDMSRAQFRQRTDVTTPRVNQNAIVRLDTTANARFRERNFRQTEQARARNNVMATRERNFSVNRERNLTLNRERNFSVNRERNLGINRDRNIAFNQRANVSANRNRNVTVTNNWRSSQFSGRQYAVFRNYHRTWHDRVWWRAHFTRVIFVCGGWWYWDAGYFYPAWGYSPYAYYPYDGPIYGYNDLAPDQIITQVQVQLRRDGAYVGPIDGVLGPMTREAIAAFQVDHGLAITSTLDEPTLDTLGLS